MACRERLSDVCQTLSAAKRVCRRQRRARKQLWWRTIACRYCARGPFDSCRLWPPRRDRKTLCYTLSVNVFLSQTQLSISSFFLFFLSSFIMVCCSSAPLGRERFKCRTRNFSICYLAYWMCSSQTHLFPDCQFRNVCSKWILTQRVKKKKRQLISSPRVHFVSNVFFLWTPTNQITKHIPFFLFISFYSLTFGELVPVNNVIVAGWLRF